MTKEDELIPEGPDAIQGPALEIELEELDAVLPAPQLVCRSMQVHSAVTKDGRRGRIVISQDIDPRLLKIVVTEPEPGKAGFRSATIALDAAGWEGMRDTFGSPYSNTGTGIPRPEKTLPPEEARRLATTVNGLRRAAFVIDEARQNGETFEACVRRLTNGAQAVIQAIQIEREKWIARERERQNGNPVPIAEALGGSVLAGVGLGRRDYTRGEES